MSQSAFNACQNYLLQPWRTVRAQGRTVRSYVFHTTRDEYRLWYNFEISRRTVRALGADRSQFILEIHQRQQCLWYKLSNSRWTVRTLWADRPPHRS